MAKVWNGPQRLCLRRMEVSVRARLRTVFAQLALIGSVAALWIVGHARALTHSEGTDRRLSLARMVSAGFVQTNGLEDRLCSRMERRTASWRSAMDVKTPCRMGLFTGIQKGPPIGIDSGPLFDQRWLQTCPGRSWSITFAKVTGIGPSMRPSGLR